MNKNIERISEISTALRLAEIDIEYPLNKPTTTQVSLTVI